MQDKAFTVGQKRSPQKKAFTPLDLRRACQRHGVGRFAEKVHPHAVALLLPETVHGPATQWSLRRRAAL